MRVANDDETKMTAFTPHRDRQPKGEDTRKSFREDNTPKYCTMWIPLTNSTCENSCLYVIPRKCDQGYMDGDDDNDLDKTPLEKCLKDKRDYQNITACPVDVGEAVVFSHRTIHWGSKPRENYEGEPRINVSFGFSDDSFEKAYLKNRNGVKVTEDPDDVQKFADVKRTFGVDRVTNDRVSRAISTEEFYGVETVEENTRFGEEVLGRKVSRNRRDRIYKSDEHVSRSSSQ